MLTSTPLRTPLEYGHTDMPIIPFGVYKGKDIENVPSSYFRWLLKQDFFIDKFIGLSNQVVKEMEWRDKWDKHFEE